MKILTNIIISMFIRHRYLEHFKLLCIITLLFGIPALVLSFLFAFDFIYAESQSSPFATWVAEFLTSFVNSQKVAFILTTYTIALTVNSFAEKLVNIQTKRPDVSKEDLIKELKTNTRAVIITLSNALGLIMMLLIGVSIILLVVALFRGNEFNLDFAHILESTIELIICDLILFSIQKWLVKSTIKAD